MRLSSFGCRWNAVVADVLPVVREQLDAHSSYELVTAGHSIGGALASLAGITFKQNFPSTYENIFAFRLINILIVYVWSALSESTLMDSHAPEMMSTHTG